MATLDELFRNAVAAIGAGDFDALRDLVDRHPRLASSRLTEPGDWLQSRIPQALGSFFSDPYLLWFIPDDVGLFPALPPNIGAIAEFIVSRIRDGSRQEQLDYALKLTAWSPYAARAGVQIELLRVFAGAGARLDGAIDDALVNGHLKAAEFLVDAGASPTLASAACLQRWPQVEALATSASKESIQTALVLVCLNGIADGVRRLLELGADPNGPSNTVYSHGTPLHHAVSSGSLESVEALLSAGANQQSQDLAWHGTPLEWADYEIGRRAGGDAISTYVSIRDRLTCD